MAVLSSTLEIVVHDVVHDVRTLQSKSTSTSTTAWCTSAVSQSTPARVNNKTANAQRTAGSYTEMIDGISSRSSLINNSDTRSTCTADNVNIGANVVQSRTIGTD